MTQLLVRIIDNSNPDPTKDKGCYKAGDIVMVRPDSWVWGKQENAAGGFLIIKAPISRRAAERLVAQDTETFARPMFSERPQIIRARIFRNGVDEGFVGLTGEVMRSPRTQEIEDHIQFQTEDGEEIPSIERMNYHRRRLWQLDITGLSDGVTLTNTQLRNRIKKRFDGGDF